MPGKAFTALLEVAHQQYGYATTEDERDLGLADGNLRTLAHRGDAERVAHGLYRLTAVPATGRDQLMEATLWPRGQGVISHATALGELWELCDVNPAKVHVTVPTRARIRRQAPAAYTVHHRNLESDEVTRLHGIPVVTAARAILDGIEAHLGGHLIDQAIEAARAQGLLRPGEAAAIDQARTEQ